MINCQDIQGHWVRRSIKAPGFEDLTTRVHWMQAGRDYADVRIPLDRPNVSGAGCLADLPLDALLTIAQSEGFAGHVSLDQDTCTWHREINWHGTPDGLDIGSISFDEDGAMIETGVLADYVEVWDQCAETETKALRFANADYRGVMVSCGEVAVVGIGQTSKTATKTAFKGLRNGHTPDNLELVFDGLHAVCRF